MNPPQIDRALDRPQVGIPWRMTTEQRENKREKLDYYFQAIERAGAVGVEVSLTQSLEQLANQLETLDAFVLPGSPSDVDPALYGARRHEKTKTLDRNRDRTDEAILEHAFRRAKPVLAICYGCQSLNVHLKGTLIQDIPSERPDALPHSGKPTLIAALKRSDLDHDVTLVAGTRLAEINGGIAARINTSHHQAIDRLGENLRLAAQAPDGIVEGVEWTGDGNWVVGVQWHPERMVGDPFAERLFATFVLAAQGALAQKH